MSGKLSSVIDNGQSVTGEVKALDREGLLRCIAEEEARRAAQIRARVQEDVRRKDNIPLQNRLVKLIGGKPILRCLINEVKSEALHDSGSQICSVDGDWVSENAPEAEIHPISDFLEEGETLKIKAANNIEVPMRGVVCLDFKIGEYTFPVPFLVTETKLDRPIIGYNVMKTFIDTASPEEVVSLLTNSIKDVDESRVETMVNLMTQNDSDDDYFLGDLRTTKPCVIPANSFTRIKCRVKGDVKGLDMKFLCSEPCVADWDTELVVTESLGELKRGRTPHVNIEIRNTSSRDIHLPKNKIVGEICAVNAVMPLNIFDLSPEKGETLEADVNIQSDVKCEEKWQPKANLDHLCES